MNSILPVPALLFTFKQRNWIVQFMGGHSLPVSFSCFQNISSFLRGNYLTPSGCTSKQTVSWSHPHTPSDRDAQVSLFALSQHIQRDSLSDGTCATSHRKPFLRDGAVTLMPYAFLFDGTCLHSMSQEKRFLSQQNGKSERAHGY